MRPPLEYIDNIATSTIRVRDLYHNWTMTTIIMNHHHCRRVGDLAVLLFFVVSAVQVGAVAADLTFLLLSTYLPPREPLYTLLRKQHLLTFHMGAVELAAEEILFVLSFC